MKNPYYQARVLATFGFYRAAYCLARITLIRALQAHRPTKPMQASRWMLSDGVISQSEFNVIQFAYGECCGAAHGKRLKECRSRFSAVVRAIRIVKSAK